MSPLPAQEKRPKIATPVLCGVVTDLIGSPIAKASVAAMWADFGTDTKTDQSGRWSFGRGTGPQWMNVDAEGFETFIFDYVDKADPNNNGADKPAFIRPPKDASCPSPIYVRLAPNGSHKGFVTLDATKGLQQKKVSQ
jgi:hypothetical protein